MRTKPSNTAHHLDSISNLLIPLPDQRTGPAVRDTIEGRETTERPYAPTATRDKLARGRSAVAHCAVAGEDEGLLHDASNLISAIGLYCDLLLMPDVLRPQHRRYVDELRQLGERSGAMIERLIERKTQNKGTVSFGAHERRLGQLQAGARPLHALQPTEGLRPAVERCAGLLARIAEDKPIEITYGEAATLPVLVSAESVERILINLVRNAVAALKGIQGDIRIGVGVLPGDAGGMMPPWPFQRVRLTIEDNGCGMTQDKLDQLFEEGHLLTARHGIGFRVVRELVEVSGGELSIVSRPGVGTRVEMEWPGAQPMEKWEGNVAVSLSSEERRRTAWQR